MRQHGSNLPHHRPFLTVIVCAYCHGAYVEQCLRSVDQEATAADLELIIIDDGSPDSTLEICSRFEFHDRLPVRIFTKPNLGLTHSLRCGLSLARGDFVVAIGSDDHFAAGALSAAQRLLEQARDKPSAVLFQARYDGGRHGELVYGRAMTELFAKSPARRYFAVCSEFPKPMLLQSTIFRTEFLRALQPWSPGLLLDDWPAFVRLFEAESAGQAIVRYEPQHVLSWYRLHSAGVHHDLARQLRATEQIVREFVPRRWRALCHANVRIDIGLIHFYGGNRFRGLQLCLYGLGSRPTPRVVARLGKRLWSAFVKRLAR